MLAYPDPAYANKELLWLAALIILVGAGVWLFRKRWIIASMLGCIVLGWGMIIIQETAPAHDSAQRSACINNLRVLDEAKRQSAADHHKSSNDTPTDSDLFGEGLYSKSKPECPSGGTYTLGNMSETPKCSLGQEMGHKLEKKN
jgi:hypothetical protein